MEYATVADFKAFSTLHGSLQDEEIVNLLKNATMDIDATVGSTMDILEDGRKFDPSTMTTVDARVLSRATCAQAEYRKEMGERFFIRGQYSSVSGPDYNTQGKLPRVGPKVWDIISGTNILRLTTQWARAGTNVPPWQDFAVG